MPSPMQAQIDEMNRKIEKLERDREMLAIDHSHSGIAGDGPKVNYTGLINKPTIPSNWSFPHDIRSNFATIAPVNNTTYNVTAKRVCYVTGIYSSTKATEIKVDGITAWIGSAQNDENTTERIIHFHQPFIAVSTIQSSNDISAFGFECNPVANITPISIEVDAGSPTYTVPAEKILVMLNVFETNNAAGFTVTSQSSEKRFLRGKFGTTDGVRSFTGSPTFLDAGDVITRDSDDANFFGYLIDK